jgi:RsiW-degrading membrane proteinase PrsW (M82 family)
MSINSLTNAALARRTDVFPINRVPSGVGEIAHAASSIPRVPNPSAPVLEGQAATTPESADSTQTALHMLVDYIPTEVITIYVAAITAATSQPSQSTNISWTFFWIALFMTPATVLFIFAAKLRNMGLSIPQAFNPKKWPLWEMIAASISFSAWAFGLPKSPFASLSWYNAGVASLSLLLVSTLLGLIAPIFQQPIKK